jgi:SAM-dependent methyltransferase
VNTSPTPEFDQYAESYETALVQSIPAALAEDRYFVEYKIHCIARRLKGSEPARFLDFGCGIGNSLECIRRQFPNTQLWGYDVSAQSLEVARSRNTFAVQLTRNLTDLPADGFDVLLAANVFHHIPLAERLEALEGCKKLIQDKGRIFLFEHNPFNPLTRLVFNRCPYDENAVMLKMREVNSLAEKAGLHILRSGYTLFFPRQLVLLRPLERFLGWFPLGAQYCVEMTK